MADSHIWCTSRVNILGPLFFIIYNNDLPGVFSDGNKIVLYADDSKLYKVIHSVHDQECLQCDLSKIIRGLMSVLSWNFHIANITAKANSILGLSKRTGRDVNDVTTLKESYPTNVHCASTYDQSPFSGPPKVWNLSISTRNPFPSVNNRTKQARFLQNNIWNHPTCFMHGYLRTFLSFNALSS